MSLIESFKQKLNAPPVKSRSPGRLEILDKSVGGAAYLIRILFHLDDSTTPIGSPPPGPGLPGLNEAKTEAPNAIMEALANIARQNITAAPSSNVVPAATNSYNLPGVQPSVIPSAAAPPTPAQTQAALTAPYSAIPPVNAPGMPFQFPQLNQAPAQPAMPPASASAPAQGFPGIVAPGATPAAPAVAGMDPNLQQQVMLIQLLASQGIPYDKIPAIVASMQNNAGAAAASATPAPPTGQPPFATAWGQDSYRQGEARDRVDYNQVRSPNRYGNRSRSRSPPRHWDSPRGRSDRDYGVYGRDSPGRGRGSDYRQRSPHGRRGRSPTPPHDFTQPSGTKWVEYDRTLPSGSIKGMFLLL